MHFRVFWYQKSALRTCAGVKMFIGGTIGEKGKLQLETAQEGIPIEDLPFYLTEVPGISRCCSHSTRFSVELLAKSETGRCRFVYLSA